MRKVLASLGWSYQKGRSQYAPPDPVEMARFQQQTQEILAALVAAGVPVHPVAADEAKLYRESTVGYRWNPRGEQPIAPQGGRRKQSICLYGTVHLGTGAEFTIQTDWMDSDWTIAFLAALEKEYPDGLLLLFWDGAPHHPSAAVEAYLEAHPWIVVIPFPPYRPDLNPKENTWHVMREDVTHHRWYQSLARLIQSVCAYYRKGTQRVVNFLETFGFRWVDRFIQPLPQT